MQNNGKEHINHKIKEKIEQHEFDFDNHAWDRMEVLLDSPTSKPYSKTILILFIMTSFFVMLVWSIAAFWGITDQPKPIISNKISKKHEKEAVNKNLTNETIELVQTKPTIQLGKLKKRSFFAKKTPTSQNFVKLTNPLTERDILKEATIEAKEDTNIINYYCNKTEGFTADIMQRAEDFSKKNQFEKVYLQLDRTLYQPEEAVWFNVFIRNGNTFKPAKSEIVYVELIAPNGSIAKKLTLIAQNGSAAGDFQWLEGRFLPKVHRPILRSLYPSDIP